MKFKNGNLKILNKSFISYEEKINEIFIKIASDLSYYFNENDQFEIIVNCNRLSKLNFSFANNSKTNIYMLKKLNYDLKRKDFEDKSVTEISDMFLFKILGVEEYKSVDIKDWIMFKKSLNILGKKIKSNKILNDIISKYGLGGRRELFLNGNLKMNYSNSHIQLYTINRYFILNYNMKSGSLKLHYDLKCRKLEEFNNLEDFINYLTILDMIDY